MNFNRTPIAPARLDAPQIQELPGDDPGEEMWIWDPVVGRDDGGRHSSPSPMSISGPGAAVPSLASQLNWT
jgi:hypothetical protein